MKSKTQALLIIPIILILVGSVVLFNSRSFSSKTELSTEFVTDLQTNTEYVTRTVQNNATSTVYVTPSSPGATTTETTYLTNTASAAFSESQIIQNVVDQANNYIMVGGQNGTWFTPSQYPRLIQISLSTRAVRRLDPVSGEGTVWSGNFNGSDWLISGWGTYGNGAPNPYLYMYNSTSALNDSFNDAPEAEWTQGDVFAASSNGSTWFLSGMGSGILANYNSGYTNHLSAGLFNGTVFTDLSALLPQQMDGILYANTYGNNEWLIGGGYQGQGVLFSWNGTAFTNLTPLITASISQFSSVESIGWNGQYWLIGGMGFLAAYNGSVFTDLTSQLSATLPPQVLNSQYYVNAIAWNGTSWMIGGGDAVAMVNPVSVAFLESYNSTNFANLDSVLPNNATQAGSHASVLTIAWSAESGWIIGGYLGSSGLLLSYDSGSVTNLSSSVGDMMYVIWVGAP